MLVVPLLIGVLMNIYFMMCDNDGLVKNQFFTRTHKGTKKCIEAISKPRIRPESKAQADEKAQHTREYVSILKRLATQRQASDGVLKWLLLKTYGFFFVSSVIFV